MESARPDFRAGSHSFDSFLQSCLAASSLPAEHQRLSVHLQELPFGIVRQARMKMPATFMPGGPGAPPCLRVHSLSCVSWSSHAEHLRPVHIPPRERSRSRERQGGWEEAPAAQAAPPQEWHPAQAAWQPSPTQAPSAADWQPAPQAPEWQPAPQAQEWQPGS